MDCEFPEPVFFSLNAAFDLIYHAVVSRVDSVDHLRLLFKKLIFEVVMKRDGFLEVCQLKNKERVTVCR